MATALVRIGNYIQTVEGFLFCYFPILYETWENKCLYLMVIVLTAKKLTWYILILYHEKKKVVFEVFMECNILRILYDMLEKE